MIPMSRKGKRMLRKFKKEPRYTHHRSEGLTHRTNKGSILQPTHKRERKA